MRNFLFLGLIFFATLSACTLNKPSTMEKNKTPDLKSGESKVIISAEIVKKEFFNKAGKATGRYEYYVRRSIQDYYVKLCESAVTKEDIEEHLKKLEDELMPILQLEVEFKDGLWDQCSEEEVQSRAGEYVVIHRIIG